MLKESVPFVEHVKAQNGDEWYYVPADKLVEICKKLRDEYKFDCLSCLTGTDRGEFLETVYHIFSYSTKEKATLKVKLGIIPPNPTLQKGGEGGFFNVPSVASIWPSADWMEREIYDLLGIRFIGHPDLRRIMLPEDWIGHPLCKDYKEPAEYCGMMTKR